MNTATLTSVSWVIMIALYVLRTYCYGSDGGEAFWNQWFRRETGILDRAEAILWLPVVFLNWRMFLLSLRQRRGWVVTGWFLMIGLGTIVLAGEEISWGQHIFHWETSAGMAQVNAQNETNFHNLNLSLLMGLTPDDALYPYFKNANYLLNPAYYLATCILFIGLPVLQHRRMLPIIGDVPMNNMRIATFFFANVIAYLVWDKVLVWDVGEVWEFAITTTFLLTGLDQLHQMQEARVPLGRAAVPPAPAAAVSR
jgi:hypothetical protein